MAKEKSKEKSSEVISQLLKALELTQFCEILSNDRKVNFKFGEIAPFYEA